MKTLFSLLRAKHWIKNFFVFAPLLFAQEFTNFDSVTLSFFAFFAFCWMSSGIYIMNDIADIESDRNHPKKKHRALASGNVQIYEGYIISAMLILSSLLISLMISKATFAIILLYFAINVLYSQKLKNIALLDVFLISSGFVLRVMAGAAAISVETSNWILLTTFSLALFLGFGKRYGELKLQGKHSRKVLGAYTKKFLEYALIISLTLSLISYALYTMSTVTISHLQTDMMIYTFPLVLFGMLRYLSHLLTDITDGDPTSEVLSDPFMIITILSWALASMYILT
jgi:decaprenyl-phosphate phosphoribosyltransferase